MKKVLVTGAHGFLGRAVIAELQRNSPQIEEIHTFRSHQYDLRDRNAIHALLKDKQCDTIIHLAARVGGIGANMRNPGSFFYDNLMMGVELVEQARLHGVQKFLTVGTICSYPKFTPVPFKESDFWNGYPEETNAPYGLAKKMLTVQLQAYEKQYGFKGATLLMVNLYGPADNFDLQDSHVIPAMLRKFHLAHTSGAPEVTLWGDGSPSREFLFVDDAARAIRLATERYSSSDPMNIGSGHEISMRELANQVKKVVGYKGQIIWDSTKPNGQPRRCLDVTKAKSAIGFSANISLPYGLESTYRWFCEHEQELMQAEQERQQSQPAL
jgi:GDP-L-fucose synthase